MAKPIQALIKALRPKKPQELKSALTEMQGGERLPAAPTPQAEGMMVDVESGRPVQGHRTPERNLNLDRIEASPEFTGEPEDLDRMLDFMSAKTPAPSGFEETLEGAAKQDDRAVINKLMKGKASDLMNKEQLTRARQIMVGNAERMWERSKDIAKRYKAGEVSDVEMLQYRQEIAESTALEQAVQGQTRKIAQTLGALRIPVGDAKGMMVTQMMAEAGGRDHIYQQAMYIGSAKDATKASKRITKSLLAKTADALIYMRTMGLLSGPMTHAKNIMGNSVAKMFTYPERAVTAGVGAVRKASAKALGYETSPEQAYASEVMEMVQGDLAAVLDALGAAKQAFRSNESAYGRTKLQDIIHHDPVSSAAFGVDPNSKWGRTLDWSGTAMSVSGRALMAGDDFYKTMAFQRELRAQAYRVAKSEGLRGAKLTERQHSLMGKMDEEALLNAFSGESDEVIMAQLKSEDRIRRGIIQEAYKSAHYETFTDPIESITGKGFEMVRRNRAVKAIVPFYTTLANIMSYAGERSPLAVATPAFYRNLQAGGVKQDEAIARLTIGVSLSVGMASLTQSGKISGRGPANWETRKMWMADGWQEYSVKIGGEWISYKGMEPMTSMMATIADLYDMYTYSEDPKVRADLALLLPVAMAESLKSQTFLMGISDFFDAINRDEPGNAKKFFTRFASSFTPFSSALRTVRRMTDDTKRMTDTEGNWGTVMNQIRNMVPGWSDSLPPQPDVWGRDKKYGEKLGPDFIMPMEVKSATHDVPTQEMILNGLSLKKPLPSLGFEGRKINIFEIRDERGPGFAYYEWQKLVGTEKRKTITRLLAKGGYWKMPYAEPGMPNEGTKGAAIQKASGLAMTIAKAKFIRKYEDQIKEQWINPQRRFLPQLPPGQEVGF